MTSHKYRNTIFSLLLVSLLITACNGQTLSNNNVIGPNVVSCSIKDNNGNLWFGTTEKGVYRYDGNTFTHFSEKEGITDKHIFSMYRDKKGGIWVGTFSGLFQYDGKQFTKMTIPHSYKNPAPDAMGNIVCNPDCILAIYEDKKGNLWLGSMGFGVYQYSNNKFNFFSENIELAQSIVQCILESKDGKIWFGTRGNGIWIYEENRFENFTSKTVNNNHLLDILEDSHGNFWFSIVGGGVRFYKNDLRSPFEYDGENFRLISSAEGLCFLNVFAMLEDQKKNIWFCGDGGGLCMYNGHAFKNYTTADGLSNNRVTTILEDNQGNIWLGTRGGGLSRYDGKTFTTFSQHDD